MAKQGSFSLSVLSTTWLGPQIVLALVACTAFWFTIGSPNTTLPEIAQNPLLRKMTFVDSESIVFEMQEMEPEQLIKSGKTDLAIAKAQDLARKKPHDPLVNLCVGDTLFKAGSKDEGLHYIKRAVALAPRSRWLRLQLAQHLALAQKNDEAVAQYQLLINAYPHWEQPHRDLAEIYLKEANYSGAADELAIALEIDGGSSENRKLEGLALARAGHGPRGFSEWLIGEANEFSTSGPPPDIKQEIRNYGSTDRAIYRFRRQLEDSPDNPTVKYLLARCLIYVGQLGEAKDLLMDARRAAPSNIDIHRSLALVLQKLGDANAAQGEFLLSVKLETQNEKKKAAGQ